MLEAVKSREHLQLLILISWRLVGIVYLPVLLLSFVSPMLLLGWKDLAREDISIHEEQEHIEAANEVVTQCKVRYSRDRHDDHEKSRDILPHSSPFVSRYQKPTYNST